MREDAPKPIEVLFDEGQETADIRRLVQAGVNNRDLVTSGAGVARAGRLYKKGLDITNPTAAAILKLDTLPTVED